MNSDDDWQQEMLREWREGVPEMTLGEKRV